MRDIPDRPPNEPIPERLSQGLKATLECPAGSGQTSRWQCDVMPRQFSIDHTISKPVWSMQLGMEMKQSALMSLAGFLDQISSEKFKAGKWPSASDAGDGAIIMPYVALDGVAQNFVKAAYDDGWIDTEFDWAEWIKSPEAKKLLNDPTTLAEATPQDLSRLVTVCIRKDRFVEGALLKAFDCGLILGIVKRAAALANLKNLPHQ